MLRILANKVSGEKKADFFGLFLLKKEKKMQETNYYIV